MHFCNHQNKWRHYPIVICNWADMGRCWFDRNSTVHVLESSRFTKTSTELPTWAYEHDGKNGDCHAHTVKRSIVHKFVNDMSSLTWILLVQQSFLLAMSKQKCTEWTHSRSQFMVNVHCCRRWAPNEFVRWMYIYMYCVFVQIWS